MSPLRQRLVLACAVLLMTGTCLAVLHTQARTGSVAGICVDKTTGEPVAHAGISLSYQSTDASDDDSADGAMTDDAGASAEATDALGSTSAPSGWRQDSADDSALDMAGAKPKSDKDFQTTTDAEGHFALPHVPAGEYKIYCNSRYSGDDAGQTVTVQAEQTSRVTLPVPPLQPSISLETVMQDWAPGETPIFGLRGTLPDNQVEMTLERLDFAGALARQPQIIVSPNRNTASNMTWPGEWTAVRHWTQKIVRARNDGSFYERVHLDPLPVGLYRVRAGDATAEAVNFIQVTSLALVRKSYGKSILAFVTDIQTGKPVAGIPIRLYTQADTTVKVLSQATTSTAGLARLSTADGAQESQGVLVAQDGPSAAELSLDLNSPGSAEEMGDEGAGTVSASPGALRSFLYTDRPIYRPGQTVHFKGIARWFGPLGSTKPGYILPANQSVVVDIRDAQETLVSHQMLKTNDMGSWNGSLTLSPEALTGEYTLQAGLGDQKAGGTFDVAAYHKPEYEVKVTFDKPRYVRGDTIQATVTATYYFGAPVSGATLHCLVEHTDAGEGDAENQTHPPRLDGDESGNSSSGEPVVDESLHLDERGQAHISIPTKDLPDGQADQTYTVSADVTDASSHNVAQDGVVNVGQGEFSLLLTADPAVCSPGANVSISAQALDAMGKPLAGQALVIAGSYQTWKDGEEQDKPVAKASVLTGPDGRAETIVRADRAGLLTIHAQGTDHRGNHVTAEADVWAPSETEEMPVNLPNLSLVLDRKKYTDGQTAHLLINTQHPGPTALITVEGSTLYRAWTVPLRRKSTSIDLPVTTDYAPGVTVSVCCILNKQFLNSSAALTVNDRRRALQITVAGNQAQYHPGDPATLQIQTRDASGYPVPAEVSVGVVDSSIYALREEPPGTIQEALQPDQGNRVETGNSCERVYLGDVDKGALDIKLRHNFPDTALWQPDVRTGPDGRATVRMTMPDTLTTWRITCVGHTRDTATGKAIGALGVSKDLLVRLEPPAFLVAGDQSTLVAVLHNDTSATLRAYVHLSATGLQPAGDMTQQVSLPPNHPTRLIWPVTAGGGASADIKITASAGALSDGVEETVPVLPHGAARDIWQAGTLLRHVDKTVTLDPGALPDSTVLNIRLSPTVSSTLLPALDYLAAYPYGSTDSTVSALIPDAILARASEGEGATPPAFPLPTARQKQLADMVNRSLLRLYRFQKDDGSWGWWQSDKPDFWMTAYATWGVTLARDARFPINPKLLEAGAKATADLAGSWRVKARLSPGYPYGDTPSALPLAALALARSGRGADAAINLAYLEGLWGKYPADRTYTDMAVAAMAHESIGGADTAKAADLMNRIWAGRTRLGALSAWTYQPHAPKAGSAENPPDMETTAWALLAAETVTPNDPRIDTVARWLMASRSGDHWSSTRTTAITLMGLSLYMAHGHEMQPDFDAHLTVNGKTIQTVRFGRDSIDRPDILIPVPGTSLSPGHNIVSLDKAGPGRLYYSLELKQTMAQPPADLPPPAWKQLLLKLVRHGPKEPPFTPSGYRIKRVYLRMTSRRNFFWEDTVPAPEAFYNQQESILVRLIIDGIRPGSHLVVEEPIPAGCTASEVSGEDEAEWSNWWDYTDVRDDKIVFFISDLTRGRHEIDYHLQAKTPGTYDIMPTLITGTFDPTLHALGSTDKITIDPKE